jgi:hypothetical protein
MNWSICQVFFLFFLWWLLVSHPGITDLSLDLGIAADFFRMGNCLSLGAEVGCKDDASSVADVLFVVSSVLHNQISFSF